MALTDDNGKPLTRAQEIMKLAFKEQGDTLAGRMHEKRKAWGPAWEAGLEAAQDLTSIRNAGEDVVNHPRHYTSHPSGIECIQVTEHMTFNLGNAVKYIWRAGLKDSDKTLQDLSKAKFYIEREAARLGRPK
ncbi:hypothetical protein H340_01189 [Streptomyces mobaraensis NBRC 13819 = DSM 40847]|uniref:DUF3310 domain-containing protein n=1 Tax=Streptomyces mobaraensis (strain ATCC 29032 / DSM 40847 / JCM 4168 / NBRC 13819 / NCIMB 11159 / IPCR 16-22) TaxID=1223523 RepID=M3B8U4_STRM1|nr:DUF3310 domain-containing protein [Streptomyces mobaraensis]EMF02418.1 hypothetical protein H340_01189 [Streptomyces mobaraensis NBRC 13819 = DSM 40847]